ncbi:uncharacterized protein OCT59_027757 [Rhizophagus irregularis]|uniref:Nbp2p n=2 Tax=Rhizophagus irregularis TaxID=588596 RepID=A0A015L6Q6_RHIIW|nr:Nbp2p [Rhizophagus irregularis DAOM 197198w]UZO07473.1 hypothetical protein OCT59_027757 [Rhizophagus irregularis]CAB5099022.1 unnamed protein product [Rhizophagus irregularis]
MKQESPTTLDIGIQQHKQFIDTPKDVTKSNKNVKDTTAASLIDKNVGNDNKNNNENNDNDNPQPIDKKISEVQPMVITNGTDIKTVAMTNGNDQNSIDNSNNNNNTNNNKSNNKSNNVNSNSKEELDDMPNKELLSKISETLAEFYGGGKDYDESEEAQKERPRSCAKVSNITLTNEEEGEGEDIVNSIYPEIKIRDFAFPTDDPRHWGQKIIEEEEEEEDSEYVNRRARALYDFVAENSSELSFHEGDILLVQCRQYDGWLMANLGEETGLIPENYVKLLDDDDDDDDDEYGNWAEEGNNDE